MHQKSYFRNKNVKVGTNTLAPHCLRSFRDDDDDDDNDILRRYSKVLYGPKIDVD